MYGKRREDSQRSRLLTTLLVTAAFLIAGAILVFNRNGFMAITEIKTDIESIQSRNDSIEHEIDSLGHVMYLLQNDSLYMEKRIREILGWGRPGEFIIRFVEPQN